MSDQPITDGQQIAIRRLVGDMTDTKRYWMVSELVGRTIHSFDDLTVQDWRGIRNRAYPNWRQDNWEVGRDFKAALAGLSQQYDETVTGQLRLF